MQNENTLYEALSDHWLPFEIDNLASVEFPSTDLNSEIIVA